jgi:uncharacterized protein YggE
VNLGSPPRQSTPRTSSYETNTATEETMNLRSLPRMRLEVTLPNQDAVGRLITAAIREVNAHVKGLTWELNPDNEIHRRVLLKATQNARQKAEAHAEALGVSLGPVIEVSDWEPYRSFEHHEQLGHFTIAEASQEPAF